jgi:SAM-dependent methyltransferase
MNVFRRIKVALATPTMRKLLRRPGIFPLREQLARKYLSGKGIEVGAMNAPLVVPETASVSYADWSPGDQLAALHNNLTSITRPDIVTDIESMDGIGDGSQDFIIANHVIEHVENPFRAVASVMRVLRSGGIAFITIPDKRFTFDKTRDLTPLDHLIRDYREGPEWSRQGHYEDWVHHIDQLPAADIGPRMAQLTRDRPDIHFHVWDQSTMTEMFTHLASLPEMSFDIEHSQFNRSEVIWILRKRLNESGRGQDRPEPG